MKPKKFLHAVFIDSASVVAGGRCAGCTDGNDGSRTFPKREDENSFPVPLGGEDDRVGGGNATAGAPGADEDAEGVAGDARTE